MNSCLISKCRQVMLLSHTQSIVPLFLGRFLCVTLQIIKRNISTRFIRPHLAYFRSSDISVTYARILTLSCSSECQECWDNTLAFLKSTYSRGRLRPLMLEKSIFKSFRVLERIKANTISTLLKEISQEDIQNLLNLCTPCIFVYRNPQCI